MINFRFSRCILIFTITALAGCSAELPVAEHRLRGVVLYDGEAPLEGTVTLLGSKGAVSTAPLGPDGRFEILNPPCGSVRVGVVNYPRGSSLKQLAAAPRSDPALAECSVPPHAQVRFPDRFADPTGSPLSVEIAPGQSELEIRLDRGPNDPPIIRKRDLDPTGVQIGDRAPDIAGVDLDDRPFKLSDYRGKVVALIYWGHWCKLCRDRYPEHIALVDRMRGRPFIMIGVNSDVDRDLVRRENAKSKIPWRTWWDGPVPGAVARAWEVEGLPYVVLIDHTGVVRRRAMDADELNRAVDSLVAEVPVQP